MTGTLFKRKWFWIVVPLLLVVAIVAVAILSSSHEPQYDGRPLSFWVDQLPTTMAFSNGYVVADKMYNNSPNFSQTQTQQPPGMGDEASNAVNKLGEKCLPYLMSRLKARDAGWKIKCSIWAMKLGVTNAPWRQNNILTAGQAVTALNMLGDRAQSVVPELLKLANDKDPSVRDPARCLLEGLKKPQPKRNVVGIIRRE
jgi:hypothetical protein